MSILRHDEILEIWTAAIAVLAESRAVLLAGIPTSFIGTLPVNASPSDQILSDLDVLNKTGTLTDETTPLLIWLMNACGLAGLRAEAHIFRKALDRCKTVLPLGPPVASKSDPLRTIAPIKGQACFLCYGSGFSHLSEPFSQLLKTVGFARVESSDATNVSDSVSGDSMIHRLSGIGAAVVLFGPRSKAVRNARKADERVVQEAVLVRGLKIPMMFIMHDGHHGRPVLPAILSSQPVQAAFDFWDSNSFMFRCYEILAALMDFKDRGGKTPSQGQLFKYKRASFRHYLSSEVDRLEVYHEALALRTCSVFHHSFELNADTSTVYPRPEDLVYRLVKRHGPEDAHLSVRFGRCGPFEVEYFVDVTPPLQPGQVLGYFRSFELPNTYPLSGAELAQRIMATSPLRQYPTHLANATFWDIVYDIEEFTMALHFPLETTIVGYKISVIHYVTREDNPEEAARCQPLVVLSSDPSRGPVLEVTIDQPLINHSYYLFYIPS